MADLAAGGRTPGSRIAHSHRSKEFARTYARWSYPEGYRYATGVIYIAAAILLAGPYRMLGLALAAMLLFLLIVTLLDHREYAGALSRFGLLGALWVRVLTGAHE